MAKDSKGKLGIALVGLGTYSGDELAPALKETEHCHLAGIVTGSPEKAAQWQKKYSLDDGAVYYYDQFDTIRDNPDIDIVYVVLPNALHADFVVRAARAGKHVICEKPMAISVEECDRMMEACQQEGRKLAIGYRLHFEPYNLELMRLARENVFGPVRHIRAAHGLGNPKGWRIEKALAGGGPLMDVGIYCIQACRYITGLEPVAVRAQEAEKTNPEKFNTVEEGLDWQLEFPGGITAACSTSYSKVQNDLEVEFEHGWAKLEPAYKYRGIKGETSQGKLELEEVNQQARQMDAIALAIKQGGEIAVDGMMGRQDVKIMLATYEAMRTGNRVVIE